MQTEAAERRRHPGRGRRGESRQGGAEPRGTQPRTGRSSGEELARLKEIVSTMQHKQKQAGERGRRAEREGEEEGEDGGRGGAGGRKEVRSKRSASEGGEGGEQAGRLRWRVHQLEKEKLQLTSAHNQEVCRLQAELTRLRSSVERGEAQRVELQYQLTVSRRDADRVAELTERAAELQQTVEELHKALDITRQAREEDRQALQQEVEERDGLIRSLGSENQRLLRLLQDQEEALEEAERRMVELKKEREKEAEVNRRQADELKYLMEREERGRREKELADQRVKSLESNIEAERAAHLESKFNCEIIQLRVRDVEAALTAERAGQQEAQFSLKEVERALGLERERSGATERALWRLQTEYEQCKSDLSVALEMEKKMTSDLTESLSEEKRHHANTHTQLEQAEKRRSDSEEAFMTFLKHTTETLQQHNNDSAGDIPPAKDDGKQSPPAEVLQLLKTTLNSCRHRQETTDRQVQDLLFASERLHEENQTLRQLTSDQSRQLAEAQQVSSRLEEEMTRLRLESSDWSTQRRGLQAELERERDEREREMEEVKKERERELEEVKKEREREREEVKKERERELEEVRRERERELEEVRREREQRSAEVQKITDHFQEESKVRLSFLYCLYQRLLAGCVLLHQPQSILGNFTWEELCDVITEQVEQLTSDLRKANDKIAHLQSVCEKKSVCVRELQRSQECVLSRLEASVRRREEAWSSQHTHTVTQLQKELQVCHSQCDSLRDRASSLELHASSLTSDLSRLQGLLSRSRRESASFLSACALLSGALRHAHGRLQALCGQKTLLCRRLVEREELEEEVRRLVGALGGDEEEEEGRRRRAVRRWRRSVCVVSAVRRWRSLANQTTVLFRVETGGGATAVCGGLTTATQEGQNELSTDKAGDDGGREGVCARWLRSKRLSSVVLSCMADLQGALSHTGSSHPDVMSAARSGLSRLLDHLLDQSGAASRPSPCKLSEDSLSKLTPPQPNTKALVLTLQQHFLLFSQRLHSAEVERRSLRLQVANLRRGLRQEREESCRTVPSERFSSVCLELRQALSREQEAQALVREQAEQLHTLQRHVDTHAAEQTSTQHTLSQTAQSLAEARQEVSRKERSLRILGKHLSGVQKERKQLEERLRRVEDELNDATRRRDCLISSMKAAETSYKEVRESLVQSSRSLSAEPRPLLLPREQVELSGAESIMGAEAAALQSLLATFAQLCHTCTSRIEWLEQEVSAHRSHVTALRSELQDACLRDNLAYVPVAEFPLVAMETPQPVPLSDSSKEPSVCLSTAPSKTNSAPSPKLSKPPRAKLKEKKVVKKKGGGRR